MNDSAAHALVAEYESLRQEFFARLESQRQAFSYLVLIAAAVIAFVGALTGSKANTIDSALLLLALPLVIAPLGFIFFDNDLVIWGIAGYIRDTLRPELSSLVQHRVLLYEGRRGNFFQSRLSKLHLLLSTGRWLLFLVPTILPLGYALWMGTWSSWIRSPRYLTLMIIDALLVMVLLWAVYESIRCRRVG